MKETIKYNSSVGENPFIKFKNKLDKNTQVAVPNTDKVQKKFATEKNPTIDAIINGLFRFEKAEQAIARLENIRNHFVTSSKLESNDENVVKLWIRGYKISETEAKEGYLGNYVLVSVKNNAGKYTLVSEKIDIELKFHPQRKRPKRKHPDWGHPALRAIKKGKVFTSVDAANKLLEQLHEEYPDVTIPNSGKLYIIIYGKAEGSRSPVQKFVLSIKKNGDEYTIVCAENKHGKKEEKPKATESKETKGYFTMMVEQKKNKKATKKPKKDSAN